MNASVMVAAGQGGAVVVWWREYEEVTWVVGRGTWVRGSKSRVSVRVVDGVERQRDEEKQCWRGEWNGCRYQMVLGTWPVVTHDPDRLPTSSQEARMAVRSAVVGSGPREIWAREGVGGLGGHERRGTTRAWMANYPSTECACQPDTTPPADDFLAQHLQNTAHLCPLSLDNPKVGSLCILGTSCLIQMAVPQPPPARALRKSHPRETGRQWSLCNARYAAGPRRNRRIRA